MEAITFVVILLSLAVSLISVSMWIFVQDFREIRRKVLMLEADRKTENCSEIPNNCEHITEDGVTCAKYPACDDCLDNPLNKVKGSERLVKGNDESTISKMEQVDKPQTPYDNCQSCLHWVYDGYWYCECNECRYEPKDEPQTYITEDRDTQILDAWQVHHRNTTSVEDEPQTDCYVSDLCKHYGDKQICGRCRSRNLFCEAEPQPRCPKCGKRGYIRSLESMGVKLKVFDEYKWKCTNCNKYFKEEPKDEPQTEPLEQFRVGLEYHTDTTHFGKTKGESVTMDTADTPQTDCHRNGIKTEDGEHIYECIGCSQTDCSWK